MDIEETYRNIAGIYFSLFGKQVEPIMSYRGTNYGIVEPWHVRAGDRECSHKTHNGALLKLLEMLKSEALAKAASSEAEANRLKYIVNNLSN